MRCSAPDCTEEKALVESKRAIATTATGRAVGVSLIRALPDDALQQAAAFLGHRDLARLMCACVYLAQHDGLYILLQRPFAHHDALTAGTLVLAVDCVSELLLATVSCKSYRTMHIVYHHYAANWDELVARGSWLTRIPVILNGRMGPWLSISALLSPPERPFPGMLHSAKWAHREREPCAGLIPDTAPLRRWHARCCSLCACARQQAFVVWNHQIVPFAGGMLRDQVADEREPDRDDAVDALVAAVRTVVPVD
jgi:hypothetical protein